MSFATLPSLEDRLATAPAPVVRPVGMPVQSHRHGTLRRTYDKDILRVGAWDVGGRRWHVTGDTLRRLVHNWQLAAQRGVRIPVVWNHSHDARDQIGEILSLYVEKDVLRARFWAAHPEDLSKLGVTANEVSVEVQAPWRDGLGNEYDVMLTHLAVVNLPVVTGQEPFRRLRLRTVAFEDTPAIDRPWDGAAAEARVRAWATRGGQIDFARYRRAFVWYDAKRPRVLGSYKLPHHDVADGRLVVNRRGAFAAMAALLGARGGVAIPRTERRRVYFHLAGHYRRFGVRPPAFHFSDPIQGASAASGTAGLHRPLALQRRPLALSTPHAPRITPHVLSSLPTEEPKNGGLAMDHQSPIDFERIKASINRLLEAAGAPERLPEDTTLENLADKLLELVASLPETMGELRAQVEQLAAHIEAERQATLEKDRKAYVAALDRLAGEGKLTGTDRQALLEVGDQVRYRLAVLSPFERLPAGWAVPTQPIARTLAVPEPPPVTGRPPMTRQRARQIAQIALGSEE